MDFLHTSFAGTISLLFAVTFFFSKCSPKLGCVLYTGAYYTQVNTVSVEDCVNIEVGSLFKYIGESNERLLRFVSDENILEEGPANRSV